MRQRKGRYGNASMRPRLSDRTVTRATLSDDQALADRVQDAAKQATERAENPTHNLPPTRRQLEYLRTLCLEMHRPFREPATKNQARKAITDLLRDQRSQPKDV